MPSCSKAKTLCQELRNWCGGDSFVVEMNIHHPTESSLIWDGMRKIVPICRRLSNDLGLAGWRQGKHLLKQIKMECRRIAQIARSKSAKVQARQPQAYTLLLALNQA